MTKYIVVSGGVISGIGKGVIGASCTVLCLLAVIVVKKLCLILVPSLSVHITNKSLFHWSAA